MAGRADIQAPAVVRAQAGTDRGLRMLLAVCALLCTVVAEARVEVTVTPSNRAVRDNIEAFIGEAEGASATELKRLARHADQQATQAARALGYYQTRNTIRFSGTEKKPVLNVDVELGPPLLLNEVQIAIFGEGAGTDAFRLPQGSNLAPGKVLNHNAYEGMKSLISRRALTYGYFSGRFVKNQLLIDIDQNQADVYLQYDTGPRYRFGEVSFSATVFDEALLTKMLTFAPGDAYDADAVARFNRDLLASGYFGSVQVQAQPELAEDLRVPVAVTLVERRPHSLGFGGGYSTDVGVRGKATWDQHWLNSAGHSRGAALELSEVRQELSGYYQIPLDHNRADTLRYFTGLQHELIDDVETESAVAGVVLNKRLQNDWERAIGLRVQHDVFSLGEANGESTLLIPSLMLQRLISDDNIDPSVGYRLMVDVQGAARGLISTVDFARVMAHAKGLYTLFDKHRLLARASLGAVATNEFDDIPPSLRFFAGGDQTVRGYGYQELSPKDRNGESIGGRYLMTSSVEYQYEFINRWRLAAFVDYGNAVNDLMDPLKTSVGAGVRWVSPIGPIRVDIAKSLSDPDEGFRIHFSMGPEL